MNGLILFKRNTFFSPSYWVFDIKDGCQTFEGSDNKCQLLMSFCKPIGYFNVSINLVIKYC